MGVIDSRRRARASGSRGIVLRLLRRRRRLSRAEIAQRSSLSEASVSRTVAELIGDSVVEEEGVERSTGGRPAIRLRLSDRRFCSIGVDVHSWETRVSIGTLSGGVRQHDCFRTPADPDRTIESIAASVERFRSQSADQDLAGIGVSVRGLVDSRIGVVELGHDPGWVQIPVGERLGKRLGLPIFVENTVRAAAFAEYHYGNPDVRDAHCLLFVGVDEGIGSAIMFDGELYRGQHMSAGEFGQMVIADGGGDARHDRPGCLEQLASDQATCQRYFSACGKKKDVDGDVSMHARQVCHLALSGDGSAADALGQTARFLGVGISNIVWGLDPDAVVVDGPIVEAWSIVGPGILEQFADPREFPNFRNLLLRPSALGGQASLLGASVLPFGDLFETGELPSADLSFEGETRSA